MLRSALALFSSLQIGARVRQSFERSLRQAGIIAVAVLLLTAAAVFGLIAAYHALVSIYQFSAVEAATIMAAGLLLVGLLVIAITPLIGARPKRARSDLIAETGEGLNLIDRSIGTAMQQVGPLPLIVIAFAAGLLASRR
jgi:hypothetical protein